jgi:hypothetical protein
LLHGLEAEFFHALETSFTTFSTSGITFYHCSSLTEAFEASFRGKAGPHTRKHVRCGSQWKRNNDCRFEKVCQHGKMMVGINFMAP